MTLKSLAATMQYVFVAMTSLCLSAVPLLADQIPTVPPTAKIRIACVGDSITQGVFVDVSQRWTTVLQNDLGPRYDVENYGVSGTTLIKNGDSPYWKQPVFTQALASQPNIVLIMLGTNDSKPQNLPSHPGEFEPDLRAMVAQFASLPTHPKIWLLLPPPVFGNGLAGISEDVLASSIRPAIRTVAKQAKCQVIDLAPVLQSHPEDTRDHVHPTPAGHLLIGNAIAAILLKSEVASGNFLQIGFIGDSITAGYNQVGNTITSGVNDVATLTLKKLSETKGMAIVDPGVSGSAYDQGISGSSTKDWLPEVPNGLETKAKSAFVTAFGQPNPRTNPVWILVMLGTNDVRSDNLFSAQKHRENILAITQDLVSSGFNVVINFPPAFVTPTTFNGVTWSASALDLLRSYLPAEKFVVAVFAHSTPGRVFLGDTSAFGYFANHPHLFQEYNVYGGLHPNGQGGTQTLADFWAAAFVRISHLQGKNTHA